MADNPITSVIILGLFVGLVVVTIRAWLSARPASPTVRGPPAPAAGAGLEDSGAPARFEFSGPREWITEQEWKDLEEDGVLPGRTALHAIGEALATAGAEFEGIEPDDIGWGMLARVEQRRLYLRLGSPEDGAWQLFIETAGLGRERLPDSALRVVRAALEAVPQLSALRWIEEAES